MPQPRQGRLQHYLLRDEQAKQVSVSDRPRPGARTQKRSEAPQKEAELAEGGGGAGVQQV